MQVIAAIASAVAAFAACASATLSYRAIRDAAMPLLSIEATADPTFRRLTLVLHNSGRGPALGVLTLSATLGKSWVTGVEDALVPAGETRRVHTPLVSPPPGEAVTAIASYRTASGQVHLVNAAGRRKQLGRWQRKRSFEGGELWRLMYPDVELPRPRSSQAERVE